MAAIYPIQSYSNEPRTLPYPVRDGFSSKYGQSFKITQMDDAHGRVRRKFGMQPFEYTITWHFTWDQLEFFEAFLKYDCAQASGQFELPLYPGAALKTFLIQKYPQINFDNSLDKWVVTATVEEQRAAPTGYAAKPPTLPVWPNTLPEPEKNGYTIVRDDQIYRSNLTAGLPTERTRFLDEVATVGCTWFLTPSQWAIFDDFVHNQLLGGLAPFQGYFANGSGEQLSRMNFTQISSAPNGVNWTVTATLEIRDIPQMSEFDYRGYGQLALQDFVTYTAIETAKLGNVRVETFGFVDSINFKIGKVVSDNYGFNDSSLVIVGKYKRTIPDTVTFAESLARNFQPAPLNDQIRFSALGQICINEYIANDYIQAGFYADCQPFSVETAGYEQFGWTEAISITSHFAPLYSDVQAFAASGNIRTRQYISLDYIEFDYSTDIIQTF